MIATPAPLSPVTPNRSRQYWGLLVVLAAILFIGGIRARLLHLPLERDEGEYAYAGQLILQGIPPYELAYNMKFPGTYAAYALIMSVFGQTPAGIHLGILCVTSLTALLVYWLGRRLMDEWTGAAAGCFCVFLSASPSMYGLAGHANHFVMLLATAGACLLWPTGRKPNILALTVSGLMFGLAILTKQQAALFALGGLAVLTFPPAHQPTTTSVEKIKQLAVFSLGVIAPFTATCLILWHAGVFAKFWFWTVTYAREYVSIVPIYKAPRLFWSGFAQAAGTEWLLWLLAAAGLAVLWRSKDKPPFQQTLTGFLIASFIAVCPGYYFRFHYFLLLVPAIALLAAIALGAIRSRSGFTPRQANNLFGFSLALALGFTMFSNRAMWFQHSPQLVSRVLYSANPFPESEPVADFIRTNSTPTDTIAILGSEPQIYFLSHRHSATSYIYMYALMEPQPFARTMQEELITQVEAARPKFVVVSTSLFSWLQDPLSDTTLTTWWPTTYRNNYTQVAVAEVVSGLKSNYFWGKAAEHYESPYGCTLVVYQRNDTLSAN